MSPELEALARRAVACKRGMKPIGRTYPGHTFRDDAGVLWTPDGDGWLPDLSDPATLGAIEHGLLPTDWSLSRSAGTVPANEGPMWYVLDEHGWKVSKDKTKAEALISALESAP
jgi:hypothetical protein